MAKGKKGKKNQRDEDAEWEALEAKKSAGKSKVDDLAEDMKKATIEDEPQMSKSQLKKQKRAQKQAKKTGFAALQVWDQRLIC